MSDQETRSAGTLPSQTRPGNIRAFDQADLTFLGDQAARYPAFA